MSDWLVLVKAYSMAYGVEPEFALAVCRMESGTKREMVRFGRLGKSDYYGPFGVKKCFLKTRRTGEVTEIGVKALRGGDKVRVLKRYNATWWENNYIRDVMACYRKYKREGVFE